MIEKTNACSNCGGKISGLFIKKCKTCGLKKNNDYAICRFCGKKQHKDNEYCVLDGAKNWKPREENDINDEENNDTHQSEIQKENQNNITSFEDAIHSYEFYFGVLPAVWESSERRENIFSVFDTKGNLVCMEVFLIAMNLMFFPEQQNDPMLKIVGMKLINDFNNENYSKLFTIDRLNVGTDHNILEMNFLDFENQKELVKAEKVFLVSSKNHSKGRVITLESNPITNDHCLCEVFSNGNRSNFGSINLDDVNDGLKRILQNKALKSSKNRDYN